MINMDYVATEVQSILAMLDANELPEVYRYLTGILDEDGSVSDEPLAIANTLTGLDKPLTYIFIFSFVAICSRGSHDKSCSSSFIKIRIEI